MLYGVAPLDVASFATGAAVLILTAMAVTPVSYIAPAREVSIVIGAFIGARYLKETDGRRRVWDRATGGAFVAVGVALAASA